MDTRAFRDALDRFVRSDEQRLDPDGTLERLIAEVPGLSSRGKLALLRLAAGHLSPGEAYLEVGSWKGLSIIAAMLGADGAPFYAIESFDGYGVRGREARDELRRNVDAWVGRERLQLLEGDFVDLLGRGGLIPEPVGVYFYDADHSSLGQYLALAVAERHLSEEAIVIIDDTASRVVARATDRYVAEHPGYELLVDLPGSPAGGRWWNGLRVYAFRRPVPAARRAGVSWRRAVYRTAYRPAAFVVGRLMPRAGLRLAHAVRSVPRRLRGHPREPIGSFALLDASAPPSSGTTGEASADGRRGAWGARRILGPGDRARRGASGALYPRSASAGLNPRPRPGGSVAAPGTER